MLRKREPIGRQMNPGPSGDKYGVKENNMRGNICTKSALLCLISYLIGCFSGNSLSSFTTPSCSPKSSITEDKYQQEKKSHDGQYDHDAVMSNINVFQKLFESTDKTWRHGYHWFYGRHLHRYRGKKNLAILEIGSRRGDSALAWKEYFGSNANIDMITYGGNNDSHKFDNPTINCANDESCGRIHTFYCDQSDAERLEKEVIAARPDGWDVVIDDGSHVPAHNIISFEVLWKHVRPGGVYVVEDIETSYYPKSTGDDTIMEIGFARNVMFVRKALKGTDSGGKSYDDYPKKTAILPGINLVHDTIKETLAIFREQSKLLDKWRP
ncbi:hypothetical protein QTG54_010878 [Skeletonema marinoi]|uniref:Rhamnosyl O-methyltransferase n=1 Tax=Skeletonema marinoi TaxID=267567 RepID=A0AAD9D9U4_9STRA|nr:hypothetical protein QTG54_010878 [Skeletonema marinoi]